MSTKRRRNNPPCSHNVYIKGLCGNCGARLDPPQSTSVSMIHSVPELKVSQELAREIGKNDQLRLIEERKLVLLVDLDQTILHTTHEEAKDDPNVKSFTLWPGHPTYYTKFRPYLQEFLDEISALYELHIFTFGCRKYAHMIASLIDPEQKYFGNRILSRDESVDQFYKKGNLNNLFPCGDAMVCIIDDRSDVWQNAGNLIRVKPYCYFKTSISDGAGQASVEDDESLNRDVDELEALLGLTSDKKKQKTEQKEEHPIVNEDKLEDAKGVESEANVEVVNVDIESEDACIKTKIDKPDSNQLLNEGAQVEEVTKVEINQEEDQKSEETKRVVVVGEEDTDDHLLQLMKALKRIYDKWYMELDRETEFLSPEESSKIAYKLPDIKDIIRKYLRKKH